MGFVSDYWRALRGPWWANALGAVTTLVPLVLAVRDSGRAWMWVSISLFAVVVIQIIGAYLEYQQRERERQSFRAQVADLFQEGIALAKELSPPAIPSDAEEIPLFAEGEYIGRAADFLDRVRDLLARERPWLLPVFQDAWDAEREKAEAQRERKAQVREEVGQGYPDALKLRDFAEENYGGPRRAVERTLTALSAVRRELGE